MYADLEKIEARGKRKKEKKGGLFSFGKKDDAAQPEPQPAVKPAEPARPTQSAAPPLKPEPEPTPRYIQPPPEPQPPDPHEPKHVPAVQPVHNPSPKPEPLQQKPAPPIQEEKSGWKPLSGSRLDRANNELLEYKKWLNKGYKSGVLTKEQCTGMVKAKEVELGLRPPE